MTDLINHPPHYNLHPSGVECIDVVEWMPCNLANAWEYLHRQTLKDSALDNTRKSLWYVRREIRRRGVLARQGVYPMTYWPAQVTKKVSLFLSKEGKLRREIFVRLWEAFSQPGEAVRSLKIAETILATMVAELERTP